VRGQYFLFTVFWQGVSGCVQPRICVFCRCYKLFLQIWCAVLFTQASAWNLLRKGGAGCVGVDLGNESLDVGDWLDVD
jgi:hypothetical protein